MYAGHRNVDELYIAAAVTAERVKSVLASIVKIWHGDTHVTAETEGNETEEAKCKPRPRGGKMSNSCTSMEIDHAVLNHCFSIRTGM